MPTRVELPAGLRPKTVPASLYITLTGGAYGKGYRTCPASMIHLSSIVSKHGEVSRENMLSAFNRLVTLGVLRPTGKQKLDSSGNARPGRLYAKYEVVKNRDEALGNVSEPVSLPPVPQPNTHVTYTSTPAPTSVAPRSASNVPSLEQRVATLEATVAGLISKLHAV